MPHQSVSNWVENAGKIVEREIMNLHMTPRNISILEMDELFTYVQKKSAKCAYGWLLIGTETMFPHYQKHIVRKFNRKLTLCVICSVVMG